MEIKVILRLYQKSQKSTPKRFTGKSIDSLEVDFFGFS